MKPLNTQKTTCLKQSANCIVVEDMLAFVKNCENESLSNILHAIDEYLSQLSESLNIEKLDLECLLEENACKPINFEAFLQLIIDKICELNGISRDNTQRIDEICETLMSCRITINMCEYVHVQDMVLYDPNGDPKSSVLHYIFYMLCQLWDQIQAIKEDISSINLQITELWAFINNLSNSIPVFLPYVIPICERLGVNTPINIENVSAQNNLIIGIFNKLCCLTNTVGVSAGNGECALSFAPSCSLNCGPYSYTSSNATTIKDALTQTAQFINVACCSISFLDTSIAELTNQTITSFNSLAAGTACHLNGIQEVFAGDQHMGLYLGTRYQYFVRLDSQYIPSGATLTTIRLIYNSWGSPNALTLYNNGAISGISAYDTTAFYLYFNLSSSTSGFFGTVDIHDAYIEVEYTEPLSYIDFAGNPVNIDCVRRRMSPITLSYQKFGYANISRVINQFT